MDHQDFKTLNLFRLASPPPRDGSARFFDPAFKANVYAGTESRFFSMKRKLIKLATNLWYGDFVRDSRSMRVKPSKEL
jgi:hypothetical protein